jgi:hypothetical protein
VEKSVKATYEGVIPLMMAKLLRVILREKSVRVILREKSVRVILREKSVKATYEGVILLLKLMMAKLLRETSVKFLVRFLGENPEVV